MTKIPLKVIRHYGNKDLRIIIENCITNKLSNLKLSSKANDKVYDNTTALHQEESNK